MVASLLAFSELNGLAGIACITKNVIAMTRKMVSSAISRRLTTYIRNLELMRTSASGT